MSPAGFYPTIGKRAFDIGAVILAVPVVLPICFVVFVVARWSLGRPTLFRQVRPGRHAKPFGLIKIRTMTEARDAWGEYLDDAARLSRTGQVLRAWSLDELPTLWNVLRGDMSVVGPRPLLTEYLPLYCAEQARRLEVRPGITGWAQVNGRNLLNWDARLRLDVWYVDHVSLRTDLWILARTVATVLRRQGIAARGHATMPKFTGSKHE